MSMPAKNIDLSPANELPEIELVTPPSKKRKQIFYRAVKRDYQRRDIGQKNR